MKIIIRPSVYVLSRQIFDQEALVRFLTGNGVIWESDSENPAEILVETAGRICYMSFANPRPGGNKTYLENLKSQGHGSVLEHAVWSLLITGVSRSLTHELIRHRAGMSYSQLSQRYVDERNSGYVIPHEIVTSNQEIISFWQQAIQSAADNYAKLLQMLEAHFEATQGKPTQEEKTTRRKTIRQAARSLLPNAIETKIVVTANARALRHFIELRSNRHADTEIRKLANLVLSVMQKEAPNLFGDYQKEPLADGTQEAITKYKKV